MDRLHVFVDEFGDPNLNVRNSGVSATYIVAALCVRDKALKTVVNQAESIRLKHFQAGEMKSSSVGTNDGRRLHIIRDLAKLDAFVIAFCAHKTQIRTGTGLEFKRSFIKFFARALYDRVTRCADDIRVTIDEHGSEQFRTELKSYLSSKYCPDLFSTVDFNFDNSKNNVLLQAADVFAGTLARVHDEKKRSERSAEIHAALRDGVSITLWPSGREENFLATAEHVSEDDEDIRRYCVKRAEDYLISAARAAEDRDEVARSIFLDALLAHHSLGEPGSFLSTPVLKREMSLQLGEPIADHRIRSAIVAKLRDAGVIISSCSKGYRIPSSASDVREFASFSNSIIPPMVARLGRARNGIKEATLGRVDILSGVELGPLKSIVESAP
ncbi:MAG: DUF3800 domain-containing protein [Pseudomonadota bacterium]|nr:DUF3800 domain-containing protein [Pseudomonadota bacterium]